MDWLFSISLLVFVVPSSATDVTLRPEEIERKAEVEAADVHNLRKAKTPVEDNTRAFLKVPEEAEKKKDFAVAKSPPTIEFVPIHDLEPEYFPASEEKGLWSAWSQSTYAPQTGCFYTAISDHRVFDARSYIVEFNPETGHQRIVLDVYKLLKRKPGMAADGKIHGWLEVTDSGDLYFATYFVRWPQPIQKDWDSGYEGGSIIRYNVVTEEAESLGAPLLHRSWPFHGMDAERGIFYAAGLNGEFLAYDVLNRRMLYGGYCPPDMKWENRAVLVDAPTGCVFATNAVDDHTPRFIRYCPQSGEFTLMNCAAPGYPLPREGDNLPRDNDNLRCHTARRSADGSYYCMTYAGTMFKFRPDEDRTELLGMNWDNGRYCGSVCMSPDEGYLYYCPGSHGMGSFDRVPVVQYDTTTRTKKVLAFLGPYYRDKYGYTLGGTFSISLLPDARSLFIAWYGRFETRMRGGYDAFGNPSFMILHIPQSEIEEE
jgi:hypothetical protein